ncbi:MAG: hypothetical protein JWM39_482 [Parcubacteria group bacterium]|nr:hypothetical protein [Parcubacteria group bacterium]
MLPKWLEFLKDPVFWASCIAILIILALVVELVRKIRRGKPPVNFGTRNSARAKGVPVQVVINTSSPASTAPPKSAASTSPKKSSDFPWLGWSAALLALVLVAGWIHYEWNSIVPYTQIKTHVPNGTPIPTTPHWPDGQPILISAPEAICTEPAQTVPVSGDETVWVDVPSACVVHALPGKYELFCKDLSGDEHPWTEQYCSSYLALGFKKKSDDDSDSDDDEDTPLEIPISFETRTSTTVP